MEVRRTAPRLSSDEVALVLRRAADLEAAAEGPGAVDGVEPAAVEEAAREVGLSPAAVRQALAELHAGALAPTGRPTWRSGGVGVAHVAPRLAVEARLVTTTAEVVHTTAGDFLRQQAFDLRRWQAERALYRRRTDVGARLRRSVNLNGRIWLTGVRAVTVSVTPLGSERPAPAPVSARPPASEQAAAATGGDAGSGSGGGAVDGQARADPTVSAGQRHMVRLEAELASGRLGARLRATAAAMAAGGAVTLAGVLVGGGLIAVAAGVAGAVTARMWWGRRLLHQRRDEVREVLAALLDVIEDPTARHHPSVPTTGRSAWSTWWSSSSAGRSWSSRGWVRGDWTVRGGRPTR